MTAWMTSLTFSRSSASYAAGDRRPIFARKSVVTCSGGGEEEARRTTGGARSKAGAYPIVWTVALSALVGSPV